MAKKGAFGSPRAMEKKGAGSVEGAKRSVVQGPGKGKNGMKVTPNYGGNAKVNKGRG